MDYFLDLINEEITNAEKRTGKSKKISYGLKIGVMVLTLCITVLLGLKFENDTNSNYTLLTRNIAFILGAFVTFLSGLMNFWNIEEYFLTNKSIESRLKSLRLKYRLYEDSKEQNSKEINILKKEFAQIVEKRGEFFQDQIDQN